MQIAVDKSISGVNSMNYSRDSILNGISCLFPQETIEYGSLMNTVECLGGLSTAREHFISDCDQVKILIQEMVLNVNSIQKRLVKRRIAYSERIHYEKKLKKRQQRMNSGKSVSLSDNAKLDRTQRKCGDALDEFTRIDDDVQHELQQFLTRNHEMATNIISKFNLAIGSYFSFVFSHYDNSTNVGVPTNNLIIPDQLSVTNTNTNTVTNSNSNTNSTPIQTGSSCQINLSSSASNIVSHKIDSSEALTRPNSTSTLKKSESGCFNGVEFASRRQTKNLQQGSGSMELSLSKA
ncbi:hypothetical protein RS030_4628 [Cryptosporidium xiaoi]|uniref:BAR domain-containing protein n=1 Tax=Cryptosporidium xiaoi TaxID=659607 RepID=A0AAV9XV31_9CRYT